MIVYSFLFLFPFFLRDIHHPECPDMHQLHLHKNVPMYFRESRDGGGGAKNAFKIRQDFGVHRQRFCCFLCVTGVRKKPCPLTPTQKTPTVLVLQLLLPFCNAIFASRFHVVADVAHICFGVCVRVSVCIFLSAAWQSKFLFLF